MKLKEIFTRQEILDFPMTQVQVAEALFLNPDTINSTERRALDKMREEFKKRNIRYEDLV